MRRTGVFALAVSAVVAFAAAGRAQDLGASDEAFSALPLARVVPAAGSLAGSGGSFFKTSVQIFNPQPSIMNGRFIYHASGTPGTGADPGLDFSIPSQETLSWDDILPAMGLSGLGTLDILLPSASSSPAIITTRVYNDAGDAGTSGFTQEAISPGETGPGGRVIGNGKWGYLVLPADLVQFRYNVGLRTLNSSANVSFTVRDSQGAVIGQASEYLTGNSFIQMEVSALLGFAPPPGGSIRVQINGGGTIVYGATVDQTTQDPSIQFARTF